LCRGRNILHLAVTILNPIKNIDAIARKYKKSVGMARTFANNVKIKIICQFGHTKCIKDSRRAKRALHWVPVEKRNQGRPRITQKDNKATDKAWDDVCLEALDRDDWKE